MQQINVSELKPHPRNNEFFDDLTGEKWNEFLESVKTRGVIESIVITPDNIVLSNYNYIKAAKELGIISINCEIQYYDNNDDALLDFIYLNAKYIKENSKITKFAKLMVEYHNLIKRKKENEHKLLDKKVSYLRKWVTENKEMLIADHNWKCDICDLEYEDILEIHHILPLKKGGDNSLENISCLCPTCHSLAHKYISFYNHDDNNSLIKLKNWINDNYSYNAVKLFDDMNIKYIKYSTRYELENT